MGLVGHCWALTFALNEGGPHTTDPSPVQAGKLLFPVGRPNGGSQNQRPETRGELPATVRQAKMAALA